MIRFWGAEVQIPALIFRLSAIEFFLTPLSKKNYAKTLTAVHGNSDFLSLYGTKIIGSLYDFS